MECLFLGLNERFLNIFSARFKWAGVKKNRNSWYLISEQTISVINLQKSSWGDNLYYINFGLLLAPDRLDGKLPPGYKAELRFRISRLVAPDRRKFVEALSDLETAMDFETRAKEIGLILDDIAVPLVENCKMIVDVVEFYQANFKNYAHLTGAGRKILENKISRFDYRKFEE